MFINGYNGQFLRFALKLRRGTSNDTIRKGANVSTVKDRIKELAKYWYKSPVINNPDIQEFVRTAVAYPDTSLAYINN